jgi:hypothetical protein
MAIDPTQPDWPLRYETLPDGIVQLAEVEQGSDADRRARAAVICCVPREHRDDDPAFGITPLQWQHGNVNTSRLAAEINSSDGALDVTADEAFEIADATRRTITVDVGQDA